LLKHTLYQSALADTWLACYEQVHAHELARRVAAVCGLPGWWVVVSAVAAGN
jgi:hypothetical protein